MVCLGFGTFVVRAPIPAIVLYALRTRRSFNRLSSQCSGHPFRDHRLLVSTRPIKYSPHHPCDPVVLDPASSSPYPESQTTPQAKRQG